MRTFFPDPAKMPGVIARGFHSPEPHLDRDAGSAQFCVALPGHQRIGILDRRHHARDAGGYHRIGAGRRLADMRARLQRHIERGAARGVSRPRQRLRFGVRTSACLRPATADNDAIFDHDRPDGRIGPGAPLPAPSERQRQLHKTLVGGLKIPDFLRVLVFQDAEDHLRNVASRASSSPESSPSTASKSLASRKLR